MLKIGVLNRAGFELPLLSNPWSAQIVFSSPAVYFFARLEEEFSLHVGFRFPVSSSRGAFCFLCSKGRCLFRSLLKSPDY